MSRLRIVSVSKTFPYGRQKVDKIAPSTGIYGKRYGPRPITGVRLRGRR
jgi:hypothetical protein